MKLSRINESLLGNLLYGSLLKFRAKANNIPNEVLNDETVKELLKRAEQTNGSLFENKQWWDDLAAFCCAYFPGKSAESIIHALQQGAMDKTSSWQQNTEDHFVSNEKENNDTNALNLLKAKAKQLARLKKMAMKYGIHQSEVGLGTKHHKTGNRHEQLEAMIQQSEEMIEKYTNELSKRDTIKNESAGNLLGKALDFLNPVERNKIGKQFIHKQQNMLIAMAAIDTMCFLIKTVQASPKTRQKKTVVQRHGRKTDVS